MRKYVAYLFDFDGTLFDSKESLLPVWRYAFKKVGIDDIDPYLCDEFSHHPLSYAAEKMEVKDYQAFYDAITEALDFDETIENIKMFPDTVALIATLFSRLLPLGIVSSNVSSHITKALKSKGMEKYFSALSCSDLYSLPKPNAEPCLFCLDKMGLTPSKDICYIGDSLQDVACADNAGITGILLDRNGTYSHFKGDKIASLFELVF
jgi:phosphoglycolate phosphatase